MLPACCKHVASMLPACCQHAACVLLQCCQNFASMLPRCCKHVQNVQSIHRVCWNLQINQLCPAARTEEFSVFFVRSYPRGSEINSTIHTTVLKSCPLFCHMLDFLNICFSYDRKRLFLLCWHWTLCVVKSIAFFFCLFHVFLEWPWQIID